jgi:hypothetical protein
MQSATRPQLAEPRTENLEVSQREEVDLPAELPPAPLGDPLASMGSLPVSLQIFFNDQLFDRCKAVAQYIAKAEGVAPRHLIGKPEACFAVISRALSWRLDPYAVAQATYQTPGGSVGFYGSLCQAIIENSGRLIGGVRFEHYGAWEKLRGKFKIITNDKGGKYAAADWRPEDEIGLGVNVSAQMRGEDERRSMRFDLVQAFPRNSTLWATDPRTQIMYTAVRRFATSTVPALFMGVPFDREDLGDWASGLQDVTPPRNDGEAQQEPPRRRGRPPRNEAAADVSRETPPDPGPDAPRQDAQSNTRGRVSFE